MVHFCTAYWCIFGLHLTVTYYDRTYKMYRKKGISRTWIYNEFEKKAFSDFEKKVAKLYRTSLSYHDVNSLTQYHFKDTNNSSKINTTGFLQRIMICQPQIGHKNNNLCSHF